MCAGGEFNKISFHVQALGSSFKESIVEMATGMKHFFWDDRIGFSNRVHNRAREQFGVGYKYTGPWGEGLVRLFANATYLVGRTFTDTGEAIGTGAAMMVAGKNGEEVALGASAFISGLCGGTTLGLAPFTPRPTIPNSTVTSSSGGNVAVLTMAPAYAVPVGNVATGILVGGAVAASNNDFGGPMQTPKSIFRGSSGEPLVMEGISKEKVERIFSEYMKREVGSGDKTISWVEIETALRRLFDYRPLDMAVVSNSEIRIVWLSLDEGTSAVLGIMMAVNQQGEGVLTSGFRAQWRHPNHGLKFSIPRSVPR